MHIGSLTRERAPYPLRVDALSSQAARKHVGLLSLPPCIRSARALRTEPGLAGRLCHRHADGAGEAEALRGPHCWPELLAVCLRLAGIVRRLERRRIIGAAAAEAIGQMRPGLIIE